MLHHSAFEGFYVIQWLFAEVWVQVSHVILVIVTPPQKKIKHGGLYLTGISTDVLLKPVKTASELATLSPHTPLLKTVKTSSLLD